MSRAGLSRGQLSRQNFIRDPAGGVMHDANEALEMNSPELIERERYFERLYNELKKQFEQIDEDQNGYVEQGELINYLIQMTSAQQMRDPT